MEYITDTSRCQDSYNLAVQKSLCKHAAKRQQTAHIIEIMRPYYPRRVIMMEQCATQIGYQRTEQGGARVASANYCRDRMCAVCAWRRQRKYIGQAARLLARADAAKYAQVFVTLTVKNVQASQISDTWDALGAAWTRLKARADMRSLLGVATMRAYEMTYNPATGTYHPHIHILAAVRPSYWWRGRYVTVDHLRSAWQDAARIDYLPQCDIRRCEQRTETETDTRAAVETLAYSTKLRTLDPAVIRTVADAMHGRRMIGYTGLYIQWRREMGMTSNDDPHDDPPADIPATTYTDVYRLSRALGVYEYIETIEG